MKLAAAAVIKFAVICLFQSIGPASVEFPDPCKEVVGDGVGESEMGVAGSADKALEVEVPLWTCWFFALDSVIVGWTKGAGIASTKGV